MKKNIKRHYFWLLMRIALGGVFITSSVYKILSPGGFAHAVFNYHILPPFLINPVAITLPWVQLVCGVSLVTGRLTKGATALIVAMLLIFQLSLATALIRGLNVACGCFEAGGSPSTWVTFLRDSSFLIVALFLLMRETKPQADGLWWRER